MDRGGVRPPPGRLMPSLPSRPKLLAMSAVAGLFSVAAYAAGVAQHGRFAISVTHSEKTTAPGRAVRYALRVNRPSGMRGRVTIAVTGLPPGVRAEWRRQGRLVDNVMRRGGRKI